MKAKKTTDSSDFDEFGATVYHVVAYIPVLLMSPLADGRERDGRDVGHTLEPPQRLACHIWVVATWRAVAILGRRAWAANR